MTKRREYGMAFVHTASFTSSDCAPTKALTDAPSTRLAGKNNIGHTLRS